MQMAREKYSSSKNPTATPVHVAEKQTNSAPHASTLASVRYFLLFFVIFVAPLFTQISEFGRKFQSICGYLHTPGALVRATLVASAISSLLGLIIFTPVRKFYWCAFMFVLALAALKSEQTRRVWPIWESTWDYAIFQSYLLQTSVLCLVPLQVWLWNRRQPVIEWARISLGASAALQSCVTVLQFFMIRHGNRDLLSELGLDSATLFTPRDSTHVYREAGRLTGLTTSPTLLGMVLTLTWPALLLEKKHGRKPPFWENSLKGLLLFFSVWAIILTYTRASYIGLGLQIVALSFLVFSQALGRRVKVTRVNLLIIAAALCSGLYFIPASGARVTAIADAADASITNRLAVYHVAANLLSERPISGWGPGFFNILYNHYYKLPHVSYSFFDTHSATINTLMEIGIAGLFLGVVAICGIRWKTLFRKTPRWTWIGILGVALPITTDNPSSSPAFMFPAIWILGVLCVSSVAGESRLVRLRARLHATAKYPTSRPIFRSWCRLGMKVGILTLIWAGFGISATKAEVSSPEIALKTLTSQVGSQANGRISYQRKIYFRRNIPVKSIQSIATVNKAWMQPEDLVVSDEVVAYFENLDGVVRYRLDAVNTKQHDASGSTTLQSIVQNYNRTYINDPISDQQVIVYRGPKSKEVAFIIRERQKPFKSLEPIHVYDPQWNPLYYVFSPFVQWDLWAPRCKLDSKSQGPNDFKVLMGCGDEKYTIDIDVSLNRIRSYTYKQFSGDTSLGDVTLHNASFDQFTSDTVSYPRSASLQFYWNDPTTMPSSPLDIPMAVTTYELQIKEIVYNNPEFSQRFSLDEFNQKPVADYRLTENDPLFYRIRPNLSDSDILAIQQSQQRNAAIRTVGWMGAKYILIAFVLVGFGVWYFRRR